MFNAILKLVILCLTKGLHKLQFWSMIYQFHKNSSFQKSAFFKAFSRPILHFLKNFGSRKSSKTPFVIRVYLTF